MQGGADRGNQPHRLVVITDTLAGGLGALVRLQAEWFTSRHWPVIVAAPSDGPAPLPPAVHVDLPAVTSARRVGEMHGARRAFRKLRGLVDPDTVVHIHGMRSFALARLAGLPTPFVSVHGAHPDQTDPPGYSHVRRAWLRSLPRLCTRAVTGEPGYPPPWDYEPHASPALRTLDVLAQAATETPTFGWLGGLDTRKQPELFVRALAQVAAAGQPVRGLLGGQGPRFGEIRALIDELQAPVEMLGQVEPAAVLRRSWALALFARSEGTPLAVMEAMWAGRMVVGSPVPGIEWLVGPTGTIAGTVDEAAAAFAAIARDRDGTAARGVAAAERIRDLVGPWTPWDTTEPHYRRYLDGASA